MKILLGVSVCILSSVLLTACGNQDDDETTSSSSSSSSTSVSGFSKHNGIYVNTDDFAFMLVDSNRKSHSLIVGDVAGKDVYLTTSGSADNNNTYITKGLIYSDANQFISSTSTKLTAAFTDTAAILTGTFNGSDLIYSFNKKGNSSESLTQIAGTYTDSDTGTVWTINTSGSLTINGDCQVSATLTRNDSYFNLTDIEASNCNDSSYDGEYEDGVLITVNNNNHDYLASVMNSQHSIIWGHIAIN
ncbi:hypothetical protein VA7868_02327 [Vibrio aerogenes CECT 7868]|uniref:Lipoprotein n=1 Tax=Vibrio aerogenes CECT 7868 TaxID=1216006 RepID=A0A1M5Z6X6_9VIBR|nr:hypothetical protein [Vibrio aerogenes]SHI19633.1 hypothetical protein VA7868_02327 [Vibrio aerogenes CECT 7868]